MPTAWYSTALIARWLQELSSTGPHELHPLCSTEGSLFHVCVLSVFLVSVSPLAASVASLSFPVCATVFPSLFSMLISLLRSCILSLIYPLLCPEAASALEHRESLL